MLAVGAVSMLLKLHKQEAGSVLLGERRALKDNNRELDCWGNFMMQTEDFFTWNYVFQRGKLFILFVTKETFKNK